MRVMPTFDFAAGLALGLGVALGCGLLTGSLMPPSASAPVAQVVMEIAAVPASPACHALAEFARPGMFTVGPVHYRGAPGVPFCTLTDGQGSRIYLNLAGPGDHLFGSADADADWLAWDFMRPAYRYCAGDPWLATTDHGFLYANAGVRASVCNAPMGPEGEFGQVIVFPFGQTMVYMWTDTLPGAGNMALRTAIEVMAQMVVDAALQGPVPGVPSMY